MFPPKPLTSPPVVASSKVPGGIDSPGPAELALMLPVIPGATIQNPATTSQQPLPNVPSKPDPPTTALPSPVPSPDSHPSPIPSPRPTIPNDPPVADLAVPPASDKPLAAATVTARLRSDENASPRPSVSNQPTPQPVQNQAPGPRLPEVAEHHQIIRSNNVPHTTDARPRPLEVVTNGVQAPSLQTPNGPNQSPLLGLQASPNLPASHAIASPLQQAIPTPPLASRDLGLPSSNDWMRWRFHAEVILKDARECPPNLGELRALLLCNACDDNDLFYLVLHQIYYEMSRDAHGTIAKIPVLGDERCQVGLYRLSALLEDNSKLSGPLLEAFCVYPVRLEEFMNAPWYKALLKQVVDCLLCLVSQSFLKTEYHREIYERRYPPLVKELSQQYGMTSPVLLGLIFMSICRHLYDPSRMNLLQHYFKKDLFLVAKSAGPDAMFALIEDYRNIPMKIHFAAHLRPLLPAPVNQRPPQPPGVAPVGSACPAVPSPVVNSPATASPEPQANGQQPPANPSPRIQSSNMASIPQNMQHAQYVDQHGRRLSSQQVWQMTRMAQGQGHPLQPVLLQPVHPAQGQGQSTQMGPVSMVVANPTPQVQVPGSTFPSQLNPSPSPSQHSAPGWPNYVVQQQQPHFPQQFQFQQQQQQQQQPQQAPSTQHRSTGDSAAQFSAASHAVQTSVISRTSHSSARQSPSVRPVPVSSPVVQVPQTQTSRPRVPLGSPLLPPEGYRAPLIVQPNPMRLGLHQADLREPIKHLVRPTPGGGLEETALYQYLGGFLLSPTRIDPEVFSYRRKFSISASDYQCFPRYADSSQGRRQVRTIQPGCRTYRLRTIVLPDKQKEDVQTFWPTANTTWPSVLYIFVNKIEVYVRRKVHNGKDIPLDITRYLREGDNEVNIHLLLDLGECKDFHYALGIETMYISEYKEVIAKTRQSPACDTRTDIKKRLNPTTDDDELAVVTDSLTIPLIDPFMAQVCNTPARSTNCTHIECFDLETFITTRKSLSGHSPMNDDWRCPICKADARPQFLIVDHFFVEVYDALKKGGHLETAQSIQVRADGKWTVKTVSDDASPSSPIRGRLSQSPWSGKRKADSITDAAEQSSQPKHENSPNVPTQEPMIIEID